MASKEWERCILFKWLKKRFFTTQLIVTIPPEPKGYHYDEDAIRALSSHPGFQALSYQLSVQASVLDAKLRSTKHNSLREVDYLQLGQFWLRYLQTEVDRIVHKKSETAKVVNSPTPEEALQQVLALYQSV